MKLRLRARAPLPVIVTARYGRRYATASPAIVQSAFGQRCRLLSNVAFDVRLGM